MRRAAVEAGEVQNCTARSGVRRLRIGVDGRKTNLGALLMSIPMTETCHPDVARAPAPTKSAGRRSAPRSAFDGKFLFAVRTTGIFCCPSCASRPAKRENVTFFSTAPRPRKRATAPATLLAGEARRTDPQIRRSSRACERIERAEGRSSPSLRGRGPQPVPFPSRLQDDHRVTPKAYARETRARRARRQARTAETVTGAIYDAGLQFFEPLLREHGRAARHQPECGQARRRGRSFASRSGRPRLARCWSQRPKRRVRHNAGRRPACAGARIARPVSECRVRRRRRRVRAHGRASGRSRRGAGSASGSSARHPRHRVPATVSAALRAIPPGKTATYQGSLARSASRKPSRGRAGLRRQPARGRDSLPSRGAHRRRCLRLSLGRRAQAQAHRPGGGVMKARPPRQRLFSRQEALTPTPLPGGEGRRRPPSPSGRRWPEGPDEGSPRSARSPGPRSSANSTPTAARSRPNSSRRRPAASLRRSIPTTPASARASRWRNTALAGASTNISPIRCRSRLSRFAGASIRGSRRSRTAGMKRWALLSAIRPSTSVPHALP